MVEMDGIPLPTQLLPCLAIPFAELFPDLCLGWWLPPSLDLRRYKKLWHLRILLQFIAWFPVFQVLLPMCYLPGGPDTSTFSLLVLSAVACIVLHNLASARQIERVIQQPLWNTNLPWDKRRALFLVIANSRPTDVNDFRSMGARYAHLPTKIIGAVIYGIVNILMPHLPKQDDMKLLGAFAVFAMAGVGIGGTRHGSYILDVIFRCVFTAGFVAVLHFVAKVSDLVLIRSMD